MIILKVFLTVILAFLALKIAWNFVLPYALVWQLIKTDGERGESTSVMPYLEIALACIAVAIAFYLPGEKWFQSAGRLAWICFGSILASFFHFFLIGMLGGAIASIAEKRPKH